jgi:hypothetical protein
LEFLETEYEIKSFGISKATSWKPPWALGLKELICICITWFHEQCIVDWVDSIDREVGNGLWGSVDNIER